MPIQAPIAVPENRLLAGAARRGVGFRIGRQSPVPPAPGERGRTESGGHRSPAGLSERFRAEEWAPADVRRRPVVPGALPYRAVPRRGRGALAQGSRMVPSSPSSVPSSDSASLSQSKLPCRRPRCHGCSPSCLKAIWLTAVLVALTAAVAAAGGPRTGHKPDPVGYLLSAPRTISAGR